MKDEADFAQVWLFPDQPTLKTVYLMSAPGQPLGYLSLNLVATVLGDVNFPLTHSQLVYLAVHFAIAFQKPRHLPPGGDLRN